MANQGRKNFQRAERKRANRAVKRAYYGVPVLQVVAPPAKQERELFLQIGSKRYQVASIEQAVAMYNRARDASEHGASKMPRVTIVTATGLHLYTISYNGRVWDIDGKPLDGMTCEEWVAHASIGGGK